MLKVKVNSSWAGKSGQPSKADFWFGVSVGCEVFVVGGLVAITAKVIGCSAYVSIILGLVTIGASLFGMFGLGILAIITSEKSKSLEAALDKAEQPKDNTL